MDLVVFLPQVRRDYARKSRFVRFPKSPKYSRIDNDQNSLHLINLFGKRKEEKEEENNSLEKTNSNLSLFQDYLFNLDDFSYLELQSLQRHLYLRHVWRLNNPYKRRIVPTLLESYPQEIHYQMPFENYDNLFHRSKNLEIDCIADNNKQKRKSTMKRVTPTWIGEVSPSSIQALQQLNAQFKDKSKYKLQSRPRPQEDVVLVKNNFSVQYSRGSFSSNKPVRKCKNKYPYYLCPTFDAGASDYNLGNQISHSLPPLSWTLDTYGNDWSIYSAPPRFLVYEKKLFKTTNFARCANRKFDNEQIINTNESKDEKFARENKRTALLSNEVMILNSGGADGSAQYDTNICNNPLYLYNNNHHHHQHRHQFFTHYKNTRNKTAVKNEIKNDQHSYEIKKEKEESSSNDECTPNNTNTSNTNNGNTTSYKKITDYFRPLVRHVIVQ